MVAQTVGFHAIGSLVWILVPRLRELVPGETQRDMQAKCRLKDVQQMELSSEVLC
jgi:hypothetical protein